MAKINRRNFLRVALTSMALASASILTLARKQDQHSEAHNTKGSLDDQSNMSDNYISKGNAVRIQYLEIVTTDVDATCRLYSQMHGVNFGAADPNFGGARIADMTNGGMLGIRAPLRDTERPVVRPYMLVKDITKSVAAAAESGAEIAMPATKIEGRGQFAIVIQGGIESGLWQL